MFASQCRTARAILGITSEELADMAGVAHDAVLRLETEGAAETDSAQAEVVQTEVAKVEAAFKERGISFVYGDRLGVRFMTLDGIVEVSAAPAKLG